jgi:hypothetical protein
METSADDQLVLDVSRQVVTDLAPDELEVFDATRDAYLDEEAAGRDKEEMLGFGIEIVAFLTPVIVMATKAVASYLSEVVANAVETESESVVAGYVKRLFRPFQHDDDQPEPLALSVDEIRKAHDVALEKATALGLKAERARLIADSIAGQLVTSQ